MKKIKASVIGASGYEGIIPDAAKSFFPERRAKVAKKCKSRTCREEIEK